MTESITPDTIQLAREGDRDSWETIIAAHQEAVFRFAYLNCGDAHEAQHIAQETFIRAWQHLDRFDEARDLRAWLLGITVKRARNRWRAAQRQLKYLQAVFAQRAGEADNETAAYADRDLLTGALQELSEAHREVVILRYFLELPVAACAETLGVAEGTVKSRLSRALAALQDTLRRTNPELAAEWDER